jgi:hypothetical protein
MDQPSERALDFTYRPAARHLMSFAWLHGDATSVARYAARGRLKAADTAFLSVGPSIVNKTTTVTYVLGDIVTDQLYLHGNPCINMDLNPSAAYWVLKASLLQ